VGTTWKCSQKCVCNAVGRTRRVSGRSSLEVPWDHEMFKCSLQHSRPECSVERTSFGGLVSKLERELSEITRTALCLVAFFLNLPDYWVLAFTQPLAEMSTRSRRIMFLGSRARPVREDILGRGCILDLGTSWNWVVSFTP
jgi:hypothetical protein